MSDAYDGDSLDDNHCSGCGARLSRFSVRVVQADTGMLLTRLCRRCAGDLAGDLMAPALPPAAARATEAA